MTRRIPFWTTRDGQQIPIKAMTDSHLRNTFAYMRREGQTVIHHGFSGPSADDMYYDSDPNPAYRAIRAEMRRRGFLPQRKTK